MAPGRNYKFTGKKHPQRAIMAVILGVISLISLGAAVYLSYCWEGEIPSSYGVTGMLVALFSLIGLILGLVTLREKDRFLFFPCLAILLNGLALGGIALVVSMGM